MNLVYVLYTVKVGEIIPTWHCY